MQTTLQIDDDILTTAKNLARKRGTSVGHVISGLARAGLTSLGTREQQPTSNTTLPTFSVSAEAPPMTPEMVRRADEGIE